MFIKQCNINCEVLQEFRQMLPLVDWDSVTILQDSNVACKRILEVFSGFFDIVFPKQDIKSNDKTLKRPWKSKNLQRCTKRKLYQNVLQKDAKTVKKDTRYIKHYPKN